jgi:hypothetical protein
LIGSNAAGDFRADQVNQVWSGIACFVAGARLSIWITFGRCSFVLKPFNSVG